MSQVNWVVLHLALTHLGVQSLCLCSPKQFWGSPHPVFQSRAMQDHSVLSTFTLRSAQALPSVVIVINLCSVELSESNSPLQSQCSPQKLVLIGSYWFLFSLPTWHPCLGTFFNFYKYCRLWLQAQKCFIDNIPEPVVLSLLFFFFFLFFFSCF